MRDEQDQLIDRRNNSALKRLVVAAGNPGDSGDGRRVRPVPFHRRGLLRVLMLVSFLRRSTEIWNVQRLAMKAKGAQMSERARERMIDDKDAHAKVLAAPFETALRFTLSTSEYNLLTG